MSEALARFQDFAVELAQYKNHAGVETRAGVISYPDCAEVVDNMATLVANEPSIAEFYGSFISKHRSNKPDTIAPQVKVIRDRMIDLRDLGLIRPKILEAMKDPKVAADIAVDEAKLFFRMFKKQVTQHGMNPVSKKKIPRKRGESTRHRTSEKGDLVKTEKDVPGVPAEDPLNKPSEDRPASPSAPIRSRIRVAKTSVGTVSDFRPGIAENSEADKKLGWEYRLLIKTYGNHPRNNHDERYSRDFAGFNMKSGKVHSNTASDDMKAYAELMGRFPLLDERAHEAALKARIEEGLESFRVLLSAEAISEEDRERLTELAILGAGAYRTFYECNLRLACRAVLSVRRLGKGVILSDVMTDACTGLERAIQKFDPKKGFKFSTYANFWLRQAVSRSIGKNIGLINIPESVYLRAVDINRQLKGRNPPTKDDLIEKGYKDREIYTAIHLLDAPLSLDKVVYEGDDTTLGDQIGVDDVGFDKILDDRSEILVDMVNKAGLSPEEIIAIGFRTGETKLLASVQSKVSYKGKQTSPVEAYASVLKDRERINSAFIGKLLGRSPEVARRRQIKGIEKIIFYRSLMRVTERLDLSEIEQVEIAHYLGRKRLSEDELYRSGLSVLEVVRDSVTLLELLGTNLEGLIDLYTNSVSGNDKIKSAVRQYLRLRYVQHENPNFIDYTRTYATNNLRISRPRAAKVDLEFFAILSGAYSIEDFINTSESDNEEA